MEQGELLGAALCLGMGILIFLACIVFFVIDSRVFHNDIETIGFVIGFESDSDGTTSIVRYVTQQGKEVTIHGSDDYEIGQQVIVRYPPDNPEKGQVKRDTIRSLFMITGLFLFLIICSVYTLIIAILQ